MTKLIKCQYNNCTICQNRELSCPDCGAHFPSGTINCLAVDCEDIQKQRKARCICGALEYVHENDKFKPTNCEKYELAEENDHYP